MVKIIHSSKHKILFLIFCVLIFLQGCSPTYPTKEEVMEGVKRLCESEYNVKVKTDIADNTLGVYMPIKGLFSIENMSLSEDALKKLDGVMLSVSRVALSCCEGIDFYTIVAADIDIPGAEVVMTRYVKDLRRFIHRDISRGEFSKRMVVEIKFNPQNIIDSLADTFKINPVTIDGFICGQASRRIIDEFQTNKDLIGRFSISECKGVFANNNFVFNVNITREGLPASEIIHGKSWHEDVLLLCAKTIAHVIWAYSFDDFEKIIINNKFDNKKLEFNKQEKDIYRKNTINIE